MVRISDILKKKLSEKQPAQEPKPETNYAERQDSVKKEPVKDNLPSHKSSLEIAKAMAKEDSTTEAPKEPDEMQIARVMRETQLNEPYSNELYNAGVELAKDTWDSLRKSGPLDLARIEDWVSEIVGHLILKDSYLFSLFYNSTSENYMYGHMSNMVILSIVVGIKLGYNKSKLNELGLIAFLHDSGMIKVENEALQTHALSEGEYNKIKEHPDYSTEALSKTENISKKVLQAINQEHERIDGKGYPKGIKGEEISEYALIIAVADVYEALTHGRPYRKKYPPHEAIKEMLLSESSVLNVKLIKILINEVGIYPVNSWVQLNTSGVGKVIINNDDFPLRPIVNIIFDSSGKRVDLPHTVNLSKQLNLFIKRSLSDEDANNFMKDKK